MASTIIIKNGTSGTPNVADMSQGEMAINLANGIPLIVSTDFPKASEKTARKSKELTAGPIMVWIPTLINLNTSFWNKDQTDR